MLQLASDRPSAKFYLPSTQTTDQTDEAGNPVLGPDGKQVKVATPQEQWGWVLMEVGPLISGDMVNVDPQSTEAMNIQFAVLSVRIREWNYGYTDPQGKEVMFPVTIKNVHKLDPEDFAYLVAEMYGKDKAANGELTDDQKKTSSAA